jgi:hypothetical protein
MRISRASALACLLAASRASACKTQRDYNYTKIRNYEEKGILVDNCHIMMAYKEQRKPRYCKEGNGQQCTVASLILKWKVSMAQNKMKYYSLGTELVPVFRLKYKTCSVRPLKQRLRTALPIGPNQVGLTISAWRQRPILCSYWCRVWHVIVRILGKSLTNDYIRNWMQSETKRC